MTLNLAKQEQQLFVGLFLLVALLLGVYHAFVLSPVLGTVIRLGRDVGAASRQLQQIDEAIAHEPKLRQDDAQLSQAIQDLHSALPFEEELPSVIEQLSTLANQTGVKLHAVYPQRSVEGVGAETVAKSAASGPLYRSIPIQLEGAGGFHQLGNFISRIESGPQAFSIKSLRISGNSREPRRHNVRITLVGYFMSAHESPAPSGKTPAPAQGKAKGAS